ncbi:CHASE2 domain-containing protein [Roseovarius sp. D22-M7]|uniref:CHASE2 domain-containing protein n=1 Tax=Roseovarius sp. D22-M7 TaxID=3127116 RepID=UPI00300FFC64
MKPRRRFLREWLCGLAMVLLGAVVIGLWHPGDREDFWAGIEGRLLDARFVLRGPLAAPPDVAILAFDDATMADLDTFPPPRAALGAAVSAAWDAGADAVAVDFLLIDPRSDDGGLAAALAQGASVLAVAEAPSGTPRPVLSDPGGFALFTGPAPQDPLPALAPVPALRAAARLGHATVRHDADGALRRMRPALAVTTSQGVLHLPGLAIAALAARADTAPPRLRMPADGIGGRLDLGGRAHPLDRHGTLPLNYLGPAGTIPTFSASDLAEIDLAGRTVFVGATAVGFGDSHPTPFDATLPGVEVHATLAANLLTGRALRRDGAAWLRGAALAVAAALAGFAAASLNPPAWAIAATLGVVLAAVTVLQAAFVAGWWLDAVTVLLALSLGAAAGAGLRRLDQRRRSANLARYQSPAMVETLATQDAPLQHQPPQPAVVLFVDVAGFTTHSEHLDPAETNAFLGLFHRLVEAAAEPSGGVIAHFAGDGALVVFGVPDPGPDDTEHALRFIDTLYAAMHGCPDWPGLGLRVGGHLGAVQVGVMGGLRHRHLSVSGDVVNTASRLLDVARASHASLALSDTLIASGPAASDWAARAGLRMAARQALRGRAGVKDVWIGEPPAR